MSDIKCKGWLLYTSIKDKNGIEFCEGDIVEFIYKSAHLIKARGVVKFGKYMAGWNDYGEIRAYGFYIEQIDCCTGQQWNICDDEIKNGEIIGNVFENPELIEKHESAK